jgi:hypothetical protein
VKVFPTGWSVDSRLMTIGEIVLVMLVLLAIPSVRRSLHGLVLFFQGAFDAIVLRSRPSALVADTIRRKIALLVSRTEASLHIWLQRWLRRSGRCVTEFNDAVHRENDARNALEHAQRDELYAVAHPANNDRLQPISRGAYIALTVPIAIGDVGFTFVAFELWDFPVVLLVPTAILFGLLGVVFGHFAGHAVHARERIRAGVIITFCLLYALVLGSMRYAYMSRQNHDALAANVISSWGVIVVLVAASAVLASQLRYRSSVERARLAESRERRLRERALQHGKLMTEALTARIKEKFAFTSALINAYRRGFNLLWRGEPPAVPEPVFSVPSQIVWPPAPPEAPPVAEQRPRATIPR